MKAGLTLGLPGYTISTKLHDNTGKTIMAAFHVLQEWRCTVTSPPHDPRCILGQVLVECGQSQLAKDALNFPSTDD